MPEPGEERRQLDTLADEFRTRYRRGERPSLDEYVQRSPHFADEIRRWFPRLAEVEEKRATAGDAPQNVTSSKGEPANGTRNLGDYRIIREVGRGGMGIVYEAEQISLGRRVALKALPPHMMSDSRYLRRFEREARAAASLHHTNIVPVFGVGHVENVHFYVMQFIPGRGLDQVIRELRRLNEDVDASEPVTGSIKMVRRTDLSVPDVVHSMTGAEFEKTVTMVGGCTPTREMGRSADKSTALGDDSGEPPSATSGSMVTAATTITTNPDESGRTPSRQRQPRPDYWRSVADIGRQVAEALHYAHGQKVVHRDIKPSNLLLDDRGTVWITDFGLAKANEQLDLTHTGDLVGTLRYVPPEAFDGKAGTSGDIYSLGLTLYELLALQPAFGATDRQVLIKQVTTSTPERLDKLNPRIPRDLVTVVHKAIEREPVHRYPTAGEMAEDLVRFLHDEPIHARRVSVWERGSRWARLNRSLASALSSLALLLLAVTIGSTIAAGYFRGLSRELQLAADQVRQEQAKTFTAFEQADRQRALASARSKDLAFQLAHGYLQRGLLLCEQGEVAAGMLWLTRSLEALPVGHVDMERAIRLNLASWQRELSRLEMFVEHHERINMARFAPDGSTILTASDDGQARLWDAVTGRPVGPPMQHQESVRVALFSPDGKTIVTGSTDGEVRLWSSATAELLHSSLRHEAAVRTAAFSPDGATVLTGGNDSTARFWCVATGEPIGAPLRHQQPVEAVQFSPDGKLVATGSWDQTVRLWDAQTGMEVGTPLQHTAPVLDVTFNPRNGNLLTGCQDGTARLWDVASGETLAEPLRHADAIEVVLFSEDGIEILTASDDRTARIWNAETREPIGSPATHPILIRAAAFSHDGRVFATGSDDHTARLWETASGRPIGTPLLHQAVVRAVSFSPDDTRILTGSFDGKARVWDVPQRTPAGHTIPLAGRLQRTAFSPDGTTLLTISQGELNVVRLWDTRTGCELGERLEHSQEAWAIAVDHGGNRVATGGYDERVQISDRTTGQQLLAPLQHSGSVHAAAFSRDGQSLVTGCRDHRAYLWDLASGQLRVGPLELPGRIYAVAISPDGSRLVTGTDNRGGRIWDAASGVPIGEPLQHHGIVQSIAFSPDGKTIVTGSFDRTAKLWDASTAQPRGEPMVHQGPVWAVHFSPNGRMVLTGSSDQTARLWDVATGLPIGPPVMHDAPVRGVTFGEDGRICLTVSEDGNLRTSPVPVPLEGEVEQLRVWSEVLTGMQLTRRGSLSVLDMQTWNQQRGRLETLGGSPAR